MLNLNSVDSREDFKAHLIGKALKDAGYRQTLLSNPGTIVEQELGREAAKNIVIEPHEEQSNTYYLVVTYHPAQGTKQVQIGEEDGIEGVVVKKAWNDPNYRRELLANPQKVVEREININIPDNVTIRAYEEDLNRLHVVIPSNVTETEDSELNDLELEAVAGGANKYGTGGSDCHACASGVRG